MQNKNKRPPCAQEMICRAAEACCGDETKMTDPVVPESADEPVFLPATQTEDDTRRWVFEHQT